MSREMDSIYSSTIGTYKKILGQFNPALENLVYLGNNYLQALHALSEVAETYYNAIKKIGEQALQNATCYGLGQLLIQMADSCKTASAGLNVVFQTLHGEIIQQMDKNTKLDVQFIHDSQTRYEMEYRSKAATLDKYMSDAWRMERQKDRKLRQMKENVNMLHSDMLSFVKESQREAELEEKRRYRFLAERHWMLCTSFLQYHNRAQGVLQARVPSWKEQIDASRAESQNYIPNRPTPNPRDSTMTPRPGDVLPTLSHGPSAADQSERRGPARSDTARRGLPRTPSSGSLSNSQQRTRSSSFGEVAVAAVAAVAANSGAKRVQALVDHNTGGNRTLLQFTKGAVITVLVPEAQNGWLYGRLEGLSATGWFPEAYVKSVDQDSRLFALRSAHSTGDLLDGPDNFPQPDYRPSPRDQGPSTPNSRRGSETSVAPPPLPLNNNAGKAPAGTRGDLFPKGTNPFATVKLRPTVTNDRSAPLIR
ncbi:brain-specific angiogenesis inhibitor 1-associated protein 2-like protein 2 isoform X2 [Spea bombifrons]|uniref:brain-specific angiogenesis inhibitor 1-associated protein 2-like protein 2 isoform X2 n=1 Tax=Spea bombifrons TaxID=233779 RepID=UPI002349770C|nr:brain-specific angiogenesis inhibitor 1-associated protein 2-like protein 2 isoform X2 [Spea bombifrons]